MAKAVRLEADFSEFDRELKQLDRRIGPKVVRKANLESIKLFRSSVLAATPKKTGTLRRSLRHGRLRESNRSKESHGVLFRTGSRFRSVGKRGVNKDGFYWHWVERGHSTPGGGFVQGVWFVRNAFNAGEARVRTHWRINFTRLLAAQ